MNEIITLLSCIIPIIETKKQKQLQIIIQALLSMRGRITMLGLSRWSEKGGSYKTITRFFNSIIDWGSINWLFIKKHLLDKNGIYLLAGDEVVVSKSGKKSYGLDKFYSSIQNRPIKGLAFLNLSLIDVKKRVAYPLITKQIIKENADGCIKYKNSNKTELDNSSKKEDTDRFSSYLKFVKNTIESVTEYINKDIKVNYFLFDGAMGYDEAVQMVRSCNYHIISKLRKDSALEFPNEEEYSGRGRPKKYGAKINYNNLSDRYLKETTIDGDIVTKIYQMEMLNRTFSNPLNVVIIKKVNTKTKQSAHVVLFSSDLNLDYDKIILYYSLRFQIEFVFRDAKQYWGMEDFMNINETPIYNWANLSTFMVNFAHGLRQNSSMKTMSILDLKAHYHGLKYVKEVFKLLPDFADKLLINRITLQITNLGAINGYRHVA